MRRITSLVLIFFIGLILYTSTLRGLYGNPKPIDFKNKLDQVTKPFELSPERGRYLLTISLGEHGSFALSKELADAAYPDIGYDNGKFFIYFAPGISILALPGYLIGEQLQLSQVLAFLTISIFASLNLVFIFVISKNILKLSASLSLLNSFIFGFATTSWSYAITLYQHHVTLFFILSSFYATWKFSNKKIWFYPFYVWLSYGLSLFIDYPNAILMIPVMVYLLIVSIEVKEKGNKLNLFLNLKSITTSIIFIVLIFLHGYYNYVNFGSPRKLSGELTGYKTILESQQKQKIAISKSKEPIVESKNAINFFSEEKVPRGISILLASRDRGLFLYSPILLLGLIGLLLHITKIDLSKGVLISLAITNTFLYSSWADPWGGWAYGPRYLIISMSILSLLVGTFLFQIKGKLQKYFIRFIAYILFAFSSAVALLGAITTNAVPPKIEADYLKMGYNFMLNKDYLLNNRSSSFVYNTFLSQKISLLQYFYILWGVLLLIAFILLFVIPLFEKAHETTTKSRSK